MLKKRIISSLWWLLAIGVTGLLVAAVQHKKSLPCRDVKVEIEGNEGHVFIDEKEIEDRLHANGASGGEKMNAIHLRTLESILNKQPWIKKAELYFDNTETLQVAIKEREPIARIFTLEDTSFYIDSSGMRLPLSKDYTAHVPVFTSFTSNRKQLSKPDSALLVDVKNIATYIQQDSFWNAQISQVVITRAKTFELIPVVGNQIIKLGSADSLSSKFDRLYAFYKQVWAKTGFEKYESVSVEFSGQVVAVLRSAPKFQIDSALAYKIVSAMRSGVDIVKDTALQFRNIAASQKNITESTNNQSLPVSFDTVRLNKNDNKVKQNAGAEGSKNQLTNQPKALMPKSNRKP